MCGVRRDILRGIFNLEVFSYWPLLLFAWTEPSDFVNYRIIVGIVAQPLQIRGLLRKSAQSTD